MFLSFNNSFIETALIPFALAHLIAALLFISAHLLIFQIYNFDKSNKLKCLNIFKSNNFLGLIILLNIIIGKL